MCLYVFLYLAVDSKSDMGKMISNLVNEGLSYLDTRSDFWRQQKPMYARRHDRLMQRRRREVQSSKLSPNDYIIKELERIDQGMEYPMGINPSLIYTGNPKICTLANSQQHLDASTQYYFKIILFCLFDLILYVPSTIFRLNRDRSSWVEPVLS